MTDSLTISELATRTGVAAGTLRMWEQRHGFPEPSRTGSGQRRYAEEDVELVRRVLAHRERGLSLPAAIALESEKPVAASDHPSLYAALANGPGATRPQVLRKRSLVALSRAIEHECLAHAAAPVLFGAFQRERFFDPVRPRYERLASHADAAVVFADFPRLRRPERGPVEVPISPDEVLGNEWAVVCDAPGYAACLLGWEQPERDGGRRFEALMTTDPRATRRAAHVAASLAGRADPALGEELEALLADRPLALDDPAPALTSLMNRMVAYLEAS
ncbi:MAG TPA: DICT sensory domain-containing protein [Baekduia sp.]|nr:DICT sensory domain-containing protein [Baekduia sp.]